MARIRAAVIMACAIALACGAAASAQVLSSTPRIFNSGATYFKQICPAPALPGHRRCFALGVTDRTGRPMLNRFVPNRFEPALRTNVLPAGYSPHQLNLAYNPSVLSTYPVGVGKSTTVVAVVDAYGYTEAERDLGIYRSTYHLPACTTANGCFNKYNQLGTKTSYPEQNLGWAQETALDLDMVSAMCPNCKIMLVEASNDSTQSLAAAVDMAVAKGAHVVSNSYGGQEAGQAADYNQAYNHPGVAITASTGDDGYLDREAPPLGANSPATSQFVTAVGGTTLIRTSANARGFTESAWSDAGSGCSKYYPKPAWQASITLCTKRMEADVSAVADPNTPVAVYVPENGTTSAWDEYGGTSVAAPLVGGLYGANGGTVVLGSLYAAGVHLNDVTTGSNGKCGGTYFCTARVGYDGPTGLGTPTSETGF